MQPTTNEIWKPVRGYEGLYEVSTLGRVKTLERIQVVGAHGGTRIWPEGIRAQSNHWKGYKYLYLNKLKRQKFFVHRLVADAFIPNPEDKPIVNHLDGNKRNNRLENLEWCTDSENQRHSRTVLAKMPERKVTLKDYAVEDMLEHALASF